jgi:hypothetical protein
LRYNLHNTYFMPPRIPSRVTGSSLSFVPSQLHALGQVASAFSAKNDLNVDYLPWSCATEHRLEGVGKALRICDRCGRQLLQDTMVQGPAEV